MTGENSSKDSKERSIEGYRLGSKSHISAEAVITVVKLACVDELWLIMFLKTFGHLHILTFYV